MGGTLKEVAGVSGQQRRLERVERIYELLRYDGTAERDGAYRDPMAIFRDTRRFKKRGRSLAMRLWARLSFSPVLNAMGNTRSYAIPSAVYFVVALAAISLPFFLERTGYVGLG